jgi:hypothetical protein
MTINGLRICLRVAFAAGFCWQAAPLGAEDLRADVARLFQSGETSSAEAIATARDYYRLLKQSRPNDSRIDYAYGLVLLNERDYDAALPLVDGYARSHGDDLHAQCVRLWALLQNRRDKDVLSEAVALAKRMPKAGANAAEHATTARFLGSVFGYLERARLGMVDRELKSQRTNELLAALGDAYLSAFDEGRSRVVDRFAELQKKQRAAQNARSLSVQKWQQEIDAALDDGKVFLAEERRIVDSSGERVQDARRRLDVIGQQISALAQDRARLSAQIMTVQALVQEQAAPRSRTIVEPDVADPNAEGVRVTRFAAAASPNRNAQVQYLALMFAVLNRQAFNLDRRILALQNDAAMAMGTGRQETQNLVESATVIGKTEKRTAALERQARRLEAKPPVPASGLTVEMTKVSTYLPLPYEEEAKRVLAWFDQ